MEITKDGYKIPEEGNEEEQIEAIEHNTKLDAEKWQTLTEEQKREKIKPQKSKLLSLAVEHNNPRIKPEIVLPHLGKLTSTFITEITPYLKNENKIYYRPEEDTIITIKLEDDLTLFKPLTPSEIITYLERLIKPGLNTFNNTTKIWEFKPKSISSELGKTILSSLALKEDLQKIKTIYTIPQPILKNKKLIFPQKGYDPELQSYLPHNSPNINQNLTIEEAKQTILDIYSEFCFKSEQDKTNAIAGLLTHFIRGLYSRPTIRTPIFFYDANRERAGKDYLAGVTGIIIYGNTMDETPLTDEKGTHEDEFRKKILSTLREGKRRFHSSNNKGYINSAQLEALSTNEYFTDRILGSNTTANYQNTLELSLSANSGITYTPDLANRSIFIHLFLDLEDPNQRHFNNPDLYKYLKDNRSKILSSLYILVKDWYDKGMPEGSVLFASFSEWAKICGGIMENAGLGNPCIKNDTDFIIGGDSETKDMKKLFELIYADKRFKLPFEDKSDWILKKDIMNLFILDLPDNENYKELFAWLDWSKPATKVKFGKLFEKFNGRIFSDIRLFKQENAKNERSLYQFVKEIRVGGVGGNGVEFDIPVKKTRKDNIKGKGDEKAPLTPQSPQDSSEFICWESISLMIEESSTRSISRYTLISYGVDEETIQKWIDEGLIYENPLGTIRLI